MAIRPLNVRLQSLIIDHAVNVRGYTANVVRRMISVLNRADDGIFTELVRRMAYMDPDSFTMIRLDAMLASVRELNRDAYAAFDRDLRAELGAFTEIEIGFFQGMLGKAAPPVFPVAKVAIDQVYTAALARPFQGALLKDWMADQEAHKAKLIRRTVADGYTQNKTTDVIVRELRGTASKGFKDGIIETTRRSAEAVVRTSLSHYSAVTSERVYSQNFDLIKEYQWTSTLDTRTTPLCQIRDGLRYTAEENPKPIGHRYPWGSGPGMLHWNCRSTKTPITKSWKDLGVDIEEFSPTERASMDGTVPEKLTYEDWLRDQSAERQDEVLGPSRGKLFRDGELSLGEMYSARGEELTLEELRKKQASAFTRAGL
ncbi:MAG TPA: phage minor head protein [Abditibacteriaceae bacterium]|jgi:SPP1 gp7 family putative phage head morphogenesis protein